MTRQAAAHFRLMQMLPVRTHEQRPPPPPRQTGRPIGNKPQHRRQQIRDMLTAKISSRVMAARLEISRTAVQRHIRAIKRERSTT